jgi:5-methylcytosine-specific restriction endonuclease McrA
VGRHTPKATPALQRKIGQLITFVGATMSKHSIFTKTCTKCGEVKTMQHFYRNKIMGRGLQGSCKSCWNIWRRGFIKNTNKKTKKEIKKKFKKLKKNNPEKFKAYQHNTRLKRREAEGNYTKKDILFLLEKQRYKCAICKKCVKKKYHVDHIQPLARGGTHWPRNLQILCPFCNVNKSSKDPLFFMRQMGFLL